jgi:hypothetical protein
MHIEIEESVTQDKHIFSACLELDNLLIAEDSRKYQIQ